jgi:hypothetical protein
LAYQTTCSSIIVMIVPDDALRDEVQGDDVPE